MVRILMVTCMIAALFGCAAISENSQNITTEFSHDKENLHSEIDEYQDYFKLINLPYLIPLGCEAKFPCAMSADFTGNGNIDFVALYEYSGPKIRVANRYIDLVFIYKDENSAAIKHEIFTHVGRVNSRNETLINLSIQPKGVLSLPIGSMNLDTLGVNIRRKEVSPDVFDPTYSWDGNKFYGVIKEDD